MKLFNGIMYHNEELLLDLRLNELKGVVDHFIVIQSATTFSGMTKPLHLSSVPANVTLLNIELQGSNPWEREAFQRNAILDAAKQLGKDTDLLVFSDADEIVAGSALEMWKSSPQHVRTAFIGQTAYYYLNYNIRGDRWRCGVADRIGRFTDLDKDRKASACEIDNSGWHFSFLGDVEWILEKLCAYSHTELSTYFTKEHISASLRERKDWFSRRDLQFEITNPKKLPLYVLWDSNRFSHYILWEGYDDDT